jgi:hypothetical protein
MKRSRMAALGAILATAVAHVLTLEAAGPGGGPGADVLVTSTITVQANGAALRIQGDGKGPYTRTSQVTSVILGGSHDWLLQTYYTAKGKTAASDRSVWFDLTEPAFAGNPPPPIAAGYLQARLMVSCINAPQPIDILTLPVGAPVLCPGHFNFVMPDLKTYYRLHFKPTVYSETDWIQVTCTAAYPQGGCGAWSFEPTGAATATDLNAKNVGRLLKIDAGGIVLDDNLGGYYLSFKITATR